MHPRSCGFLHCVNIMCCTTKQRTAFYTVCKVNQTMWNKRYGSRGMDHSALRGMDRGMDQGYGSGYGSLVGPGP